jgi:vacuolar-type H+-ATPase subunit I/STV1
LNKYLENCLDYLSECTYNPKIINPYLVRLNSVLKGLKSEEKLYLYRKTLPNKIEIEEQLEQLTYYLQELQQKSSNKEKLTSKTIDIKNQSNKINQELKKINLSGLELAVTVNCSDPKKLDFYGVEKSTPFFVQKNQILAS